MAVFINLFQNWLLTKPSSAIVPGAAAITGIDADLSTWSDRGTMFTGNDEPHIYSKKKATGILLSGGQYWYDFNIDTSYAGHNPELDDTAEGITHLYNREFCGKYQWSVNNAIYDSFICIWRTPAPVDLRYIRFGFYYQNPQNVDTDERKSYSYGLDIWTIFDSIAEQDHPYTQVRVYRAFLNDTDYYLIACGVAGNGTYTASTSFYLIPTFYFEDKEIRNWVGETAEDDSETAFSPPDGGEWHDSITTRTNYDVNPYGVNNVGSFKVVFPTVSSGGAIMPEVLQFIITGIYRGSSENVLNQLGQVVADITGGNANRPAEEVQAIISAIISVHSVPVIYPTGTAGSYAQAQTTFKTISGYDVAGLTLTVTSPGQKTIFEWVYTTDIISRRLNCFLDFEPFTTLILKLPFFPPVSLSPSAVFGHRLQVDYKIDILTGLLSADVSTTDDGGTYYIITTLQGNVKTAIPIMGQGAQNAVLEKISGAIVSASKYGAIVGGAAGAFSVYNEIAQSGHGVAVGDMSVDGLGAYLSPRAAYIICSHPVAAIPASYSAEGAIVGDFLKNIGMAANLGGKVGDFAGGFASFSAVDLSGVPCTDDEKREILRRLTEGVYL